MFYVKRLQRLQYSLDIAKAAGLKKPVFGNTVQGINDDPDFPVALGADGIAQKLQIVKTMTDVSELNAGFRNREYRLTQLPVGGHATGGVSLSACASLAGISGWHGSGAEGAAGSTHGAVIACGSVLFSAVRAGRP